MQKMMCKKSIGLLLFVIAAIMVFPLSVFADNCESFIKKNQSHLDERYGIRTDYNEETEMITNSMYTPSVISSIKSSLKFKIVSIKESNNDKSLTATDPYLLGKMKSSNQLTDKSDIVFENLYSGFVSYVIDIVPDGFIDPAFQKACPDAVSIDYHIILYLDLGGKPTYKTIELPNLINTETTNKKEKINCANTYDTNSFEYKFCDMKKKAAANSGTKTYTFDSENSTYSKLFGADSASDFYCDAFVSNESSYYSSYYLQSNTSYLVGTIESEISGPEYQYVYHYGGFTDDKNDNTNCKTKTEKVSCKTRCEEVVSVEYGAPVASTAGLCFEYKVQVTSRVNCEADMPNPPKTSGNICTPIPSCTHSWGWVFTQAGPNEDFDRCVNKCDGGKYTDKCTNKCYKQVYGTSTKKSGNSLGLDTTALKLANEIPTNDNTKGKGNYYYSCTNNTIRWQKENVIARWYVENEKNINWRSDYDCVKDKSNGGGILSLCDCSAKCRWTGCKGDQYMNAEDALKDNENNAKVYNSLKSKCSAYASCKTTQATFTIDVDYTYGKGKKTTIHFPYSKNDGSQKDTIQYGESNSTKTVTCTDKNKNTTLISFDGCYRCGEMDAGQNFGYNMYRTEWGFPGTWLHNKSGEISYEPVDGSTLYSHKFCIPFDANTVNAKWWTYYYARKYGHDNTYSFNDNEYLSNIVECPNGSTADGLTCHYKDTGAPSKDEIEWNIKAQTREFGYFGWNININCFYGLNNEFPNLGDCEGNCISGEETLARVRSVDLQNLFPDKDNVKLESPTTTGRSPGFNWSSHATNVLKDTAYQSRPSSYTKWVQTLGYDVYSDEYLDYEVQLTANDIKKLKSPSIDYTAFEGTTSVDSVVNYKSPLFRDAGILKDHSKFPNEDALKCNNMKNWQSSECQDITVGGEVE